MDLKSILLKYYLPPQNVVPKNRCFSIEHIVISTLLFLLIAVIFSDIAKKKNRAHSIRVLKTCAWIMLLLEIFRIAWNAYYHGFSLTSFRFDFCNQICMVLPFCILFGNKKIYPYIQLLAIIGGLAVLLYPLWVFYDYAGFHIMALQSMVSHALMLLCGLLMPYASGIIPRVHEETRDSLIGFGCILIVAYVMSNVTGQNYLLMKSADGVPVLSLIPYPWYWIVFLVLFFFVCRYLSMVYQDFLCLSARLPLGSRYIYKTRPLSREDYLNVIEKLKYRFLHPFKNREEHHKGEQL